MAKEPQTNDKPAGVSPARKAISAIVLIALLVVAGIELRASLGQRWAADTIKTLNDPQGEGLAFAEAEQQLAFGPSRETVSEGDGYIEYKYTWTSLLRPDQLHVFLRSDTAEPPQYIGGATEEDIARVPADAIDYPFSPDLDDDSDDEYGGEDQGGPDAAGGRPPMDDEGDAE